MSTLLFTISRHDWPEDFVRADGSHGPFYSCKCRECKVDFYGNKHRRTCKSCVEMFKRKTKKP